MQSETEPGKKRVTYGLTQVPGILWALALAPWFISADSRVVPYLVLFAGLLLLPIPWKWYLRRRSYDVDSFTW